MSAIIFGVITLVGLMGYGVGTEKAKEIATHSRCACPTGYQILECNQTNRLCVKQAKNKPYQQYNLTLFGDKEQR